MFTTEDYLINQPDTVSAVCAGLSLYNRARGRGWTKRLWATVTGRNRELRRLSEKASRAQRLAGIRTVSICNIVGSEDRSGDFDRDFNPLRDATRDRWLSVYRAWVNGVALPPVELVRGPDGYYVRDGHHRLSVARALGQDYVEAVVIE